MLTVTVVLSCSEGTWSKTQDIVLNLGQGRELHFGFPEPTIAAENIGAIVKCSLTQS
jgi:hypothetical protein